MKSDAKQLKKTKKIVNHFKLKKKKKNFLGKKICHFFLGTFTWYHPMAIVNCIALAIDNGSIQVKEKEWTGLSEDWQGSPGLLSFWNMYIVTYEYL